MTEPSQYFKGRTVQEQMDEVIGYVDARSAEVATTAIASDVAQVHQDMLDADADATAAAASAAAAAGTLANAVKKTGEASQSIAGDIAVAGDLSGGTVTVPTPVNNTDAASKKYVDDADALKLNITDVPSIAVTLTNNQGPITGTKSFTDLASIPHMTKASMTYYRWFSIPVADATYALTACVATRYASFIDLVNIVVSGGVVTSVTKQSIGSAGTNNSMLVGAFTEDGKIVICIHLNANNQYVCPTLLGFHGNYGDTVNITSLNTFNVNVGTDYTEVAL